VKRYVLGISGASGSVYAVRVAKAIAEAGHELHLVFSAAGERVMIHETGMDGAAFMKDLGGSATGKIFRHESNDLFAPIASGSFRTDGMAIVPCSMAAVAAIAGGSGGDLLRRAADVHLKERRPLVVVFRETPLSSIHLRNLLVLSDTGALILPAAPAFYNKPTGMDDLVDFIAARVLSGLGMENDLIQEWGSGE